MTNNEQTQINEIMDFYDFKSVEKVLTALKIKWSGLAQEEMVEGHIRMQTRLHLIKLLAQALIFCKHSKNNAPYITSHRGFKYTFYIENDVLKAIELEFIVSSWMTEYADD